VKVEFTEDGGAKIYVGTQSNGQGHETVYAQFLPTRPASRLEKIEIVQGDSDLIATGGGTGRVAVGHGADQRHAAAVESDSQAFAEFLPPRWTSRPGR
jgi:carbon-monoxide dehydrogenase large subunit